jgi:hypothetical protein
MTGATRTSIPRVPLSHKPSAVRMRKKRAKAAERDARKQSELPVLGDLADALVDQKLLGEWDAENPEAVKRAVLEALEKLAHVTRHQS